MREDMCPQVYEVVWALLMTGHVPARSQSVKLLLIFVCIVMLTLDLRIPSIHISCPDVGE